MKTQPNDHFHKYVCICSIYVFVCKTGGWVACGEGQRRHRHHRCRHCARVSSASRARFFSIPRAASSSSSSMLPRATNIKRRQDDWIFIGISKGQPRAQVKNRAHKEISRAAKQRSHAIEQIKLTFFVIWFASFR